MKLPPEQQLKFGEEVEALPDSPSNGVAEVKYIENADLVSNTYTLLKEDNGKWLSFETTVDVTVVIDTLALAITDFEVEGNAPDNNTLTFEEAETNEVIKVNPNFTKTVDQKGVFGYKRTGFNYGHLFGTLIPV